jgi:hypothetical protein
MGSSRLTRGEALKLETSFTWPVFHPHIIEPFLVLVKHVPGFRCPASGYDGIGVARIRWRAAG